MGTKRQVDVNICSVEGNLAGILVSKVSPSWNFRYKGKMNTYYFRRDKTAVLGAIKAPATIFGGQISAAKFLG